jgi:hypothetical protein
MTCGVRHHAELAEILSLLSGIKVMLYKLYKFPQVDSTGPQAGGEEVLNLDEALNVAGMLVQEEGKGIAVVHWRAISVAGEHFTQRGDTSSSWLSTYWSQGLDRGQR